MENRCVVRCVCDSVQFTNAKTLGEGLWKRDPFSKCSTSMLLPLVESDHGAASTALGE